MSEVRHDFEDRVALVTGGSKGIGRATAIALAEQGATVGFTYLRDRDSAESVLAELAAEDVKCAAFQCHLREADVPKQLVASVRRDLGEPEFLVSNAATGMFRGLTDLKPNHWSIAMDTNAAALLRLVQSARELTSVVAMSSLGATRVLPGYGPVGISKATLEAIVRYLAVELAPTTRVNAVRPGLVETESVQRLFPQFDQVKEASIRSTPMQRLVNCEDVAAAILFLLSGQSSMVTGHTLTVDGGSSLALGMS